MLRTLGIYFMFLTVLYANVYRFHHPSPLQPRALGHPRVGLRGVNIPSLACTPDNVPPPDLDRYVQFMRDESARTGLEGFSARYVGLPYRIILIHNVTYINPVLHNHSGVQRAIRETFVMNDTQVVRTRYNQITVDYQDERYQQAASVLYDTEAYLAQHLVELF